MSDPRRIEISSTSDLWSWLETHHDQSDSVWLVTYKKCVPDRFVGREDILDALIAHGWIDGRRKALDARQTMQLIAPRRQQVWAASYKARAARLTEEGRMHPAGAASVARGKASGQWNDYADVDALVVPGDLEEALRGRPPAVARFGAFAPSARRNILRWIKNAKTEATRTKRIGEVAQLAQQNLRPKHM